MADNSSEAGLQSLLAACRAGRNFVIGLIVGGVVTVVVFYLQVVRPAATVADSSYYLVLGVVLGLSIALLLAVILSIVTLYRRSQAVPTR